MSQNVETPATTEPAELLRFFSTTARKLVSLRADGSMMVQEVGGDWKKARGHKTRPDLSVEQFIATVKERYYALPRWAQEIKDLPSMDELGEWVVDSVCETPSGDTVEPDGHGPDGAPSWLLALGLI